jgi:flagellar export protein FliJ
MSVFRYRLDRLLHLRMSLEEERGRDLGEAIRDVDERRKVAVANATREVQMANQVARLQTAAVTAGLAGVLAQTMAAASGRTAAVREAVTEAESTADEYRAQYSAARIDRRALEQLRHAARGAWEASASRKEQQELDEFALRRHQQRPKQDM